MNKTTREQAITIAAKEVFAAADFSKVGDSSFFKEGVTSEGVQNGIKRCIETLEALMAMTNEQWDQLCASNK